MLTQLARRLRFQPRWLGATALVALALLPMGLRAARRHNRHEQAKSRAERNTLIPSVDHKVVEHGDTLWSLCAEVTGKPWLWPQVWAYNPGIRNPHWLHPGIVVAFVPNGHSAHKQGPTIASSIDLPDVQEVDAPTPEHKAPSVELVNTAHTAAGDKRNLPQHVFTGSFVSQAEFESAGQLTNAAPDKILLRSGDDLFVTFPASQAPKVGDKFYIFRTADRIRHPITHKNWGYMTEVTGLATVTGLQNNVARARLERTVLEVERGQRIMPYTEDLLLDVMPSGHHPDVSGIILAVQGVRTSVGEQSVVFLDKGKADGVQRGDELAVGALGDPVAHSDGPLPTLDMATLMVVDAKQNSATCLVVDSLYEIRPGNAFHAAPELAQH
jgi:hypothetical protein